MRTITISIVLINFIGGNAALVLNSLAVPSTSHGPVHLTSITAGIVKDFATVFSFRHDLGLGSGGIERRRHILTWQIVEVGAWRLSTWLKPRVDATDDMA
jgi:hypothetical protein